MQKGKFQLYFFIYPLKFYEFNSNLKCWLYTQLLVGEAHYTLPCHFGVKPFITRKNAWLITCNLTNSMWQEAVLSIIIYIHNMIKPIRNFQHISYRVFRYVQMFLVLAVKLFLSNNRGHTRQVTQAWMLNNISEKRKSVRLSNIISWCFFTS